VESSVRLVFERMMSLGVNRGDLEVKVFGGGKMLTSLAGTDPGREFSIGRRNVETALKVIQELGLTIAATDVGGTWGRKLMYYPHWGDVWVKKIVRTLNSSSGE
jgi:chemotaxis protein CheD